MLKYLLYVLLWNQDLISCFNLQQLIHSAHRGHNTYCQSNKPINYEACRTLFLNTPECSVMSYENKMCSFHDSFHNSFYYGNISSGIVFTKIIKKTFSLSPLERYRKCIAMIAKRPIMKGNYHLPKLGIIVSVTKSYILSHRAGIESVVSNLNCYANAHNYSFVRVF